jgi:steroid 5-alpha reductase family enzyme
VLYNLFVDTFNTFIAVRAVSLASPVVTENFVEALGWKQWAGIGLFITGVLIETLSEESRKHFKANPANKGKINDTGLWSVVRHPNYTGLYYFYYYSDSRLSCYTGYTMWRSGVTLATVSIYSTL